MPSYDLATAAFAINAPKKWVDNLTSHYEIRGVISRQRGVSREFSFEGIVLVSLIRALSGDLRIPLRRATQIVGTAARPDLEMCPTLRLPYGVILSFDVDTMIRQVRQRLMDAAESVPRARRGRPRADSSPPNGTS